MLCSVVLLCATVATGRPLLSANAFIGEFVYFNHFINVFRLHEQRRDIIL